MILSGEGYGICYNNLTFPERVPRAGWKAVHSGCQVAWFGGVYLNMAMSAFTFLFLIRI